MSFLLELAYFAMLHLQLQGRMRSLGVQVIDFRLHLVHLNIQVGFAYGCSPLTLS